MEIRKVQVLRGPNVWAMFPVLEARVDLGRFKDLSPDVQPGLLDRLLTGLHTSNGQAGGTRNGFADRPGGGTALAHFLAQVTLELQARVGPEVDFGQIRATSEPGVHRVAVQYANEELARACLEASRALCQVALEGKDMDIDGELGRLRQLAGQVLPSPTEAAFLEAARRRGIPVAKLGGPLLQLGQGARQHRLIGAQSDRTSALAASTARDSELVRMMLRASGVPVPEGRVVTSADDAWAAAQEVGLPVIVKPRYGFRRKCGRNLTTPDQVRAAYAAVAEESSSIVVEREARGAEWRLLVVGQRVVAAARRQAGALVDVRHLLHPQTAAQAVEAVVALGLDVAGVDIVAKDIRMPLRNGSEVVTAVVPNPPLTMPSAAGPEDARPAAEAILGELFPSGQNGRIPVVAVTGVNGKTTTTRLIAHLFEQIGKQVGMTCTEGIYVKGRRTEVGDCSGPLSARAVLCNPVVEAAVLETARGGILRAGLGFDRCDVAVVTNIADGDHLGVADINTPEQLAAVKRTIVQAVAAEGSAVLKADDPLVADMANHCPGSVIFFARDEAHPILVAHRGAGGRVVFVRDSEIVFSQGAEETPLAPLQLVPFTHGGRVGFQVENALAAAAAGWALRLPLEGIRRGLTTFACDFDGAPARFNLLELDDATFIFDYGHNVVSLSSVIRSLDSFPHGRRTAVYSAAGDRRDADIVRQGELLAQGFDRVILYEEENCIRGRRPGEIPGLFRQGLALGRRVRAIEEVKGALSAVEVALRSCSPGDLVLVQVDLVDETMQLLRNYLAEVRNRRHVAAGMRPPARASAVASR